MINSFKFHIHTRKVVKSLNALGATMRVIKDQKQKTLVTVLKSCFFPNPSAIKPEKNPPKKLNWSILVNLVNKHSYFLDETKLKISMINFCPNETYGCSSTF